jgi:hypothetical protein
VELRRNLVVLKIEGEALTGVTRYRWLAGDSRNGGFFFHGSLCRA